MREGYYKFLGYTDKIFFLSDAKYWSANIVSFEYILYWERLLTLLFGGVNGEVGKINF